MDEADIIGLLAGTGTTLSFLPQVIQVFRTKSAKDLSPYMVLTHTTGATFWVIYGALKEDPIIMGFNLVTMMLVSLLTLFKIKESMMTEVPLTV